MQAPEDERRRLLGAAIDAATNHLRAPIDRIEVSRAHVACWGGGRKVLMTYDYSPGGQVDPTTGKFTVTAGSGSWDVYIVDPAGIRGGPLRRLAASLFGARRPSA
ncbi:MAG TPA: hypothetical protein VGI95_11350 [Caulobacteraceae bacterium]